MRLDEIKRFVVDREAFPSLFPTHRHSAEFWEHLGRVVASYGFLEETLGKAIFALTATREYSDAEIKEAYLKWQQTLERALSDPLAGLIDSYAKALRTHGKTTLKNADDLLSNLRAAAKLRNVLCHGSWGLPDKDGKSIPFFVTSKMEIFETPIDADYLDQVRLHVVELITETMNSVTHMGWQFPGSVGPGEVIMTSRKS